MLTEVSPTAASVQSRDQASAESARGKMERCAAEPRSREKADKATFPCRQKIIARDGLNYVNRRWLALCTSYRWLSLDRGRRFQACSPSQRVWLHECRSMDPSESSTPFG